jgi:PUA domain protein
MFRRFDPSTDVSTSTQVKASVQRSIKSQISSAHPEITDDLLDELMPKKCPLLQYKVGPHLMLYCQKQQLQAGKNDEEDCSDNDDDDVPSSPREVPIFFQHRDGPILPTLKLVHKYPSLQFTKVIVDKGAIPFLLGGANVMCPGLTNPGGYMPPDIDDADGGDTKPGLQKDDGVVIYAEGKEFAIAVGVMSMSSLEV